jgi:hypothetical protein
MLKVERNPATLATLRDLELFEAIIAEPFDSDFVKNLISSGALEIQGAVYGQIRWPRSMATISTPDRGTSFSFTTWLNQGFTDYEKGITQALPAPLQLPYLTTNGPDDDDYYRVSFSTTVQHDTQYRLQIVVKVFTIDTDGHVLEPYDVETRFRFHEL